MMHDIVENKKIKLDFASLILSCIGFGLFLWGFTNVATDGWTNIPTVILPIVVGVIVLVFFGFRQLKLKDPFLDISVFKIREFTMATLTLILVTMAMYGVEMMLPTYLQNVHGLSPLNSGLTLLPGALMLGIISPVAGILYNKVGVKPLTLVGLAILTIGTLPFAFLSAATPSILITVFYGIRMLGIAIAMMPLMTNAMSALPNHRTTHGTAANNTARQIASSVVVALLSSVTQNIINGNTPAKSMQTTNPIHYASKLLNASMDGFRASFIIGLVFAVVGIVFALFLKKDLDVKPAQPEEEGGEQA